MPVVEYIPALGDTPAMGHGVVLVLRAGDRNVRAGAMGTGLRPPAPSSVEPNGIPTRAVGDEADAAGPAKELLSLATHVPDALPAMPPPSNVVGDPEVPPADRPVP
jgi:hypothetical protein